jgi:hypothetical protein
MKRSEVAELLREYVREQLSEMNTTGAVGAYQTPNAFSKDDRDNLATKFMAKMGFKKTQRPNRPSSTKMVDYRQ